MADTVENDVASGHPGLVSVIMPAYNAEKYILEAIMSVIHQTYAKWELVVVDDGSTDATAAIVKELLAADNRIKYVFQDNGGQGKARNNGLNYSTGKYIAFLDADDLWLPEKLRVQVEAISKNKADLLFSDAYLLEGTAAKTFNIIPGYYQGESAVHKFISGNYIPLLTVLLKRSAIENVKGFSELREIQNAEDYHLWIRLLINGCLFLGTNRPLAQYRIHDASVTSGEGKILFPALNCLKDIATTWPRYSADINQAMYSLINDHLAKVNISRWDIADRLLETRNGVTKENVSISFWKRVYFFFGKNIFRMLFNLKVKRSPGNTEHIRLKFSLV